MNSRVYFNKDIYLDTLRRGGIEDNRARVLAAALELAFNEKLAIKPSAPAPAGSTREIITLIKADLQAFKRDLVLKMVGIQIACAGLLIAGIKLIG